MAQDLQTSSLSALPTVDLRDPSTIMFLPPWLAMQIGAVSDLGAGRTIIDPKTGKITGRVATIPRSKMPTGPQRVAITRRIEELRDATRPGPENRTLALVGEIVNEQAPTRLDTDTADIRIDGFMDAVEDLPHWALREALRRWRRGDVSDKSQLPFGIKPHKLREMALAIRASAEGQAIRLQRILDAESEEPLTEELMAANAKRMEAVLAELRGAGPRETPAGTQASERASALSDISRMEGEAKRKASEQVP